MNFYHRPVLLEQTIQLLNIRPDGNYVDGTLGGGGHSYEIASRLKGGRLIAIDRDSEAIAAATERLTPFLGKVILIKDNFSNIKQILTKLHFEKVDGIILDLGVSSHQLDEGKRGFSYRMDAPLDMRMSKDDTLTAYEVVNEYPADELTRIFKTYGEERFSYRIAKAIDQKRKSSPVKTTVELAEIIKGAIPAPARREGGHPAKRVFQALRIEVNNELENLKKGLYDGVACLKPGGVIAVITFHSLEDRMVKSCFSDLAQGCTCPKDFPVCVCHNTPKIKILTKKPVTADEEEIEVNNRAHSAKLRAAQKI